MSSGFESSFDRIIKRKEKGRLEMRGRRPKPVPVERVDVPAEFAEPQPAMTRPVMGVFLPARKGRSRR